MKVENVKHIVALSGGKDSTAMAFALKEREPRDYEYVCTPTGNELGEMFAHWVKLGDLLGKPLKPVTCGKSLDRLVNEFGSLPSHHQRWCTRMLKIEPFQAYVLQNLPCVVYVAIRADEFGREGVDHSEIASLFVQTRWPLVEMGWALADVLRCLNQKQIVIPTRTDCALCFYQRLYEWWRLWKFHREQWEQGKRWETLTGHTIRNPNRDSWPASLAEMEKRFEAGEIPTPKTMQDRRAMCSVCAR